MFDRPHSKRDPVHREGSGIPQNGRNGPPTVETGILLIGRGVAYRKTDLLRSKQGSCSSGGVWRTAKWDSTRYCSSPPSTSSSLHHALLHRLLFKHPSTGTPPPSTVHPTLHTTGSCSTTPQRAPLHRLLFTSPPHHGVLFIQRQCHRSLFIHPPLQRSLFIQTIGFS